MVERENKGKETIEQNKKEQTRPKQEADIVRIMSSDIYGNKKMLVGLRKIKGVSWSFANAICQKLKINPEKKIGSLSQEDIKKIEEYIKKPEGLPKFLLNRRKDLETGENKHLLGSDLDLQKEFDIKRLRKIRSYRGLRHSTGQPVRGQRTRAHFREKGKKRKALGVKKVRKGKKG